MIPLLLTSLTLLFAGAALAADTPTVALCEGAEPAQWAATGQGAGLTFLPAGAEAVVTCRVVPEGWELRARGADGKLRGVRIAPPTTPARQAAVPETVWALLDAAGLRGSSVPDPSVPPPPPSLPPPTAESTEPAPPPPSPVVTASEPPPLEASAPPPLEASAPPPLEAGEPPPLEASAPPPPEASAPAPGPTAWIAVGPGVVYRPETSLTSGLSLTAGVLFGRSVWTGAQVVVLPTRALTSAGLADAVRDVDALLSVGWSPTTRRVAPLAAVGGGLASHTWTLDGGLVDGTVAPLVAAEAGVMLRVFHDAPHLALVPLAHLDLDLGTTQLGGVEGVPVVLTPVQAQVALTLRSLLPVAD